MTFINNVIKLPNDIEKDKVSYNIIKILRAMEVAKMGS